MLKKKINPAWAKTLGGQRTWNKISMLGDTGTRRCVRTTREWGRPAMLGLPGLLRPPRDLTVSRCYDRFRFTPAFLFRELSLTLLFLSKEDRFLLQGTACLRGFPWLLVGHRHHHSGPGTKGALTWSLCPLESAARQGSSTFRFPDKKAPDILVLAKKPELPGRPCGWGLECWKGN